MLALSNLFPTHRLQFAQGSISRASKVQPNRDRHELGLIRIKGLVAVRGTIDLGALGSRTF